MSEYGVLYVVATPIGNLGDITSRAVEVLKNVDQIAAEDTRHTLKLLNHLGINTKCYAYHDHNEKVQAQNLIKRLCEGVNIALVSDAGTPLISDPGYPLVNQCREHGIMVIPIPGCSAVTTALCAAGLPTDRFSFEGFTPAKSAARQQCFTELKTDPRTLVFYESPRRIKDSLEDMQLVFGKDRRVVLAKELTKSYERFRSGSVAELLEWIETDEHHQKGEMVLMVKGYDRPVDQQVPDDAMELMKLMMQELPLKKAAALTAKYFNLKKNALYQAGLELDT